MEREGGLGERRGLKVKEFIQTQISGVRKKSHFPLSPSPG
jgi:hypothetical protein